MINHNILHHTFEIDALVRWTIETIVQNNSLRVYNTLTRSKEIFKSITPGKVLMYSCGPTVYSDAHIWNLRSYIFPDILKKLLWKIGYKDIQHIINITDVGHLTDDANDGKDKMELSAHNKGETVWEISERYTEKYLNDIKRLWIEFPLKFTKATDYIEAQIDMVKGLEERGFTYKTEDGIYFDTSKFETYWDFAKLDIHNLREWERIDFWDKQNKTDFALWKFSPQNEKRQMEWESPWWIGFPGWHIECSAMIWKALGSHIDIHTWWTDHISVHHTNEIAQATCFHWEKPVNYWMHWEFLVLNENKKIWKSEWNAITLDSLIEKWFSPIAYRYLVLTAHYRNFLNFSYESLWQAEKAYKNLKDIIYRIYNTSPQVQWISEKAKHYISRIISPLLDDLNTANTLTEIRSLIVDNTISDYEKLAIVSFFDEILWLNLFDFSEIRNWKIHEISNDIRKLSEKRWDLKKEWKFQEADNIRKEIEKSWYILLDFKDSYEIRKR